MQIITKNLATPFGELILGSYGEELCLCDWYHRRQRALVDERLKGYLSREFISGDSSVIRQIEQELLEYFQGERIGFSVPLLLLGTDFQKHVWETLLTIPYGVTLTYGELAARMGKLSAIRGVAAANGANALAIIIPCHRVVGASGEMVGYSGGLWAKRKLLDLENPFREGQIPLFDPE